MSNVEVDVRVDDPRWRDMIEGAEAVSQEAINTVWTNVAGPTRGPCEVSVVLTDDAFIRNLNRKFRGHDRATDVLAFSGTPVDPLAAPAASPAFVAPIGDIVVAFETARSDALSRGTKLADHLSHLLVHGMLHLLGYDHKTDKEAAEMERLETRLLSSLQIADPYDGH